MVGQIHHSEQAAPLPGLGGKPLTSMKSGNRFNLLKDHQRGLKQGVAQKPLMNLKPVKLADNKSQVMVKTRPGMNTDSEFMASLAATLKQKREKQDPRIQVNKNSDLSNMHGLNPILSGVQPIKQLDKNATVSLDGIKGAMAIGKGSNVKVKYAKDADISRTKVDNASLTMGKVVGDNNKANDMVVGAKGTYKGPLMAQVNNANIAGQNGSQYGALGSGISAKNATLTGKVAEKSLDNAVAFQAPKMLGNAAVVERPEGYDPRKLDYATRQAKFAAMPAPTGSIRARKNENQFPQLKAA